MRDDITGRDPPEKKQTKSTRYFWHTTPRRNLEISMDIVSWYNNYGQLKQ